MTETIAQLQMTCPHERTRLAYTGDGTELCFCSSCGKNWLTGGARPVSTTAPYEEHLTESTIVNISMNAAKCGIHFDKDDNCCSAALDCTNEELNRLRNIYTDLLAKLKTVGAQIFTILEREVEERYKS